MPTRTPHRVGFRRDPSGRGSRCVPRFIRSRSRIARAYAWRPASGFQRTGRLRARDVDAARRPKHRRPGNPKHAAPRAVGGAAARHALAFWTRRAVRVPRALAVRRARRARRGAVSRSPTGGTRFLRRSEVRTRAPRRPPRAQLEATCLTGARRFVAELRGGGDDFGDDFVSDARERASAAAARWKMWGVEGDDGRKRRASTHSSLAAGGRGGWGNVDEQTSTFAGDQPGSSRSRSLSLRAASPVERTGTESFGDPPPVDVTLAEDPRMSRVEVLAWA